MFNFNDMMGRIKEMQDKLKEARAQLDNVIVESEAGGGMVRVKANANRKVLKITIDPDIIDKEDPEIMEDLIAAAVNKAMERAEEKGREELQQATQGMMPNIPGLDLSKFGDGGINDEAKGISDYSQLEWKALDEEISPLCCASTYENLEIVVIDNGSTDNSVSFLKSSFPQLRLIEFVENYGFTDGHNRALPYLDSPYLLLLNSDVEIPDPEWIEPLVEIMEMDEKVAAIQPKIIAHHDKQSFEHAGAAGGFIDRFGYPFCRGRLFDEVEKDEGQYNDIRQVFWATGACSLIRRSVIDEIGLFESDFFAHMEEIDFCWRAQNYGYKIMVQPASKVYHVGGGALPQGNPRKTYLNIRNSLGMLYKNLPKGQLFPKIFTRLVLDGIWGARQILKGDLATVGAIFRAHFHFYAKIPQWQKRRKEIYQSIKPQMKHEGYYPGSIVWQHFAKGKKTWNELMK